MSLEPKKEIPLTGMDENEVSPKPEENQNTVPINDIMPQNETDNAPMEENAQKSEEAPSTMPQSETIDAAWEEMVQKLEQEPNPIPTTETNDVSMEEIPQKSAEIPQQSEKTLTEVKGTGTAKPEEQEASTSLVMVEQPNTIIELVDLYVPPVSLVPSKVIFMNNDASRPFFSPAVPQTLTNNNPTLLYTEPTGTSAETPSCSSSGAGETDKPTKGGRRRGRKPATPKPRPTKRRRRAQSPPPLPPPPNFLENCINPLENEIYPKVIVQPAHQPWVLPRDLNGGDPPKVEVQPPVAVPVSSIYK